MKRHFFVVLGLLGLVLGLAACGVYGGPERPDGAEVYTYPSE